MIDLVELDGPIKFIFENGNPLKEKLIPAIQVEEFAGQLEEGGNDLFDQRGFILRPKTYYKYVTEDGTRAIRVRPKFKIGDIPKGT
jgi:hypothetical protein